MIRKLALFSLLLVLIFSCSIAEDASSNINNINENLDRYIEQGTSRQDLIDKLTYLNLSAEEAEKLVDARELNFEEMAQKAYYNYVTEEKASPKAAFERLKFAQFTEQEIKSALDLHFNKLNWANNVIPYIEKTTTYGGYSRDRILDKLEDEGFEEVVKEDELERLLDSMNIDYQEQADKYVDAQVASGASKKRLEEVLDDYDFEDIVIASSLNRPIDWKAAAVGLVKKYENSYFSEKAYIEQLEYEGLDSDLIDYAMSQFDIDYNQNCLNKYEQYLSYDYNEEDILKTLRRDNFTDENIEYAVKNAKK